jgi:hypothetical protein
MFPSDIESASRRCGAATFLLTTESDSKMVRIEAQSKRTYLSSRDTGVEGARYPVGVLPARRSIISTHRETH